MLASGSLFRRHESEIQTLGLAPQMTLATLRLDLDDAPFGVLLTMGEHRMSALRELMGGHLDGPCRCRFLRNGGRTTRIISLLCIYSTTRARPTSNRAFSMAAVSPNSRRT